MSDKSLTPATVLLLQKIWLDGFGSGVASVAAMQGATNEQGVHAAQTMTGAMQLDPAAMLMIETEVNERLAGNTVGGVKSFEVYGKDKP